MGNAPEFGNSVGAGLKSDLSFLLVADGKPSNELVSSSRMEDTARLAAEKMAETAARIAQSDAVNPAPDAAKPTPDAAKPAPDAAKPTPDAAKPTGVDVVQADAKPAAKNGESAPKNGVERTGDIKLDIINHIDNNLTQLETEFHQYQARNGLAPAFHNWLSATIGVSPDGSLTGLWGYLFNKDATNDSISDRLRNARESWKELKAANEAGDEQKFIQLYRSMTDNQFGATLSDVGFDKMNRNITSFGNSQIFASELFSETVATVAAGLTLGKGKSNAVRGLLMSAFTSGAAKAVTKQIDGTNPDLERDFSTGMNSGIALAGGGLVGGFVSRRIGSAMNLTTSGGTFYTTLKLTNNSWALRGLSAASSEGVSGGTYGFTKTLGDQISIRAIQTSRGQYDEFQPFHLPFKETALGFLGGSAFGLLRTYKGDTPVQEALAAEITAERNALANKAPQSADDLFRYGTEQPLNTSAQKLPTVKDIKAIIGNRSIKAKMLVPEIQRAAAGKPHSAGIGANIAIQTGDKESPKNN